MNRMESFEIIWAARHNVPAETLAQYRFETRDGYRLPDMASHFRTHCAALDYAEGYAAGSKEKNTTIGQNFKRCFVCGDPNGHGMLACPRTVTTCSVLPGEMQ